MENSSLAPYAAVSAGRNPNDASDLLSVILGGRANKAMHVDATIRGGCSQATTKDCQAIP